MSVAETIETRVRDALQVEHLELENESGGHNVPPGSESHFRLVVVSPEFEGASRVRRHQRLYGLFTDLMPQPVHALRLHVWTPEEWAAREGRVDASPACRGGGREHRGEGSQ